MFPKLISIDSFFLPTYGVLVAAAFLVALWLTGKLAQRVGLSPEPVTNLGIYSALAGLLGAKLGLFLFDFSYYRQNPGELVSLSTIQAAGVYQVGLALALVTAVVYMRRNQLPGLLTADVFAPGLALGHGIGRLGCFSAGCCWGAETRLPWAVTFTRPDAHDLVGVPLKVPLHPTQLYEAVAEFLICGVLVWRFGRPHRAGAIIAWYLALYSLVRFLVEFVRWHDQPLQGGLSLTQWISLAFLTIGVGLLVRRSPVLEPRKSVSR